jgi:hypothetical protein
VNIGHAVYPLKAKETLSTCGGIVADNVRFVAAAGPLLNVVIQ